MIAPSDEEVERIRLLLSTYQDGTGQLALKGHTNTLPNWRDFERSVAVAMKGEAQESKSFFDVIVKRDDIYVGISCKMRAELRSARKGIVYVEVSNAAGDFWEAIGNAGVNSGQDMIQNPYNAGKALIDLVESWHHHDKAINLDESYYLICQYDTKSLEYQLFQLPLGLPDPDTLEWKVRVGTKKQGGLTHCLVGGDGERAIIEWYADSGGQLKYYPGVESALWQSDIFTLESLPDAEEGYSIMNKAKAYFPELWKKVGL